MAEQTQKSTGDSPDGDGHGAEPQARFRFIDTETLLSNDYRSRCYINGVLVADQPAVIAGPSKSLKTSLSIDAAVSMAAGVPFLGKFDVPKPLRVAVVSGESGGGTLQETCRRVMAARGVTAADLGGRLKWEDTNLPTLSDVASVAEFADVLLGLQTEVVFIDPLYLALGPDVDMRNLFEAGAAFRVVTQVLLKAGVTPVLLHHANRQLTAGEPMELQHLAYSGLEQFARQFLLLNRIEKYRGDGTHDIWLSVGGSAGHGGLWALHVEEGTVDENFRGRRWDVTVQTPSELHDDRAEQKDDARAQQQQRKDAEADTAVLDAIDAEASASRPATRTRIHTRTKIDPRKLGTVLARLVDAGVVEEYPCEATIGGGGKRKTTAFRRVKRSSVASVPLMIFTNDTDATGTS